jgi:hypothetical protein
LIVCGSHTLKLKNEESAKQSFERFWQVFGSGSGALIQELNEALAG